MQNSDKANSIKKFFYLCTFTVFSLQPQDSRAEVVSVGGIDYAVTRVADSITYNGVEYSIYNVEGCYNAVAGDCSKGYEVLKPLVGPQLWKVANTTIANQFLNSMPTPGSANVTRFLYKEDLNGTNIDIAWKDTAGGIRAGNSTVNTSWRFAVAIPTVRLVSTGAAPISPGGRMEVEIRVTSRGSRLDLNDIKAVGGGVVSLRQISTGVHRVTFVHDGVSKAPSISIGDNAVLIEATGLYNVDGADENNTFEIPLAQDEVGPVIRGPVVELAPQPQLQA